MTETTTASLFFLGLLGSGHCLGMCGPLVIAIPGRSGKLSPHLAYHLGRIATYVFLGTIIGLLGKGLAGMGAVDGSLILVTRIQVAISLIAATFLGVLGLIRLGIIAEPRWLSLANPSRLPGFRGALTRAQQQHTWPSTFIVGAMFGYLPCGLSYAAFARALPSADPFAAALMLLAFGLGTLPALLLLGTAFSRFAQRHARICDILAGMVMIGMSVSLLIDGMSV